MIVILPGVYFFLNMFFAFTGGAIISFTYDTYGEWFPEAPPAIEEPAPSGETAQRLERNGNYE